MEGCCPPPLLREAYACRQSPPATSHAVETGTSYALAHCAPAICAYTDGHMKPRHAPPPEQSADDLQKALPEPHWKSRGLAWISVPVCEQHSAIADVVWPVERHTAPSPGPQKPCASGIVSGLHSQVSFWQDRTLQASQSASVQQRALSMHLVLQNFWPVGQVGWSGQAPFVAP